MIYKNFVLPTALLSAMIIGAGMFALPFVFSKTGLAAGLFYLLFFGVVFSVVHLLYADIIFRTGSERFRFVSYAKIYLGREGFWVSVFTTAVGLLLTMTIYVVLSASFFGLIFPALGDFNAVLIFWLVSSIFIFSRIERLANSEFLVTAAILAIIVFIFFFGFFKGGVEIGYFELNPFYFFLPFGPVLFSLAGRPAISSIVDYFDRNNIPAISARKVILAGTLVPALAYFIFAAGILKISPIVTEDAVSGIAAYLPSYILAVIGLLGLFSLWSSYTVISREVEGIFELDFHVRHSTAVLGVILIPIVLYFFDFHNFLFLVTIAGGIFLVLESILVVLMWLNARKNGVNGLGLRIPPFVLYGIILVFLGGMIVSLL